MIGYVSVKSAKKHIRREAEKLSHGQNHRIGELMASYRKEGETLLDALKRMKEENEALKKAAEESPVE